MYNTWVAAGASEFGDEKQEEYYFFVGGSPQPDCTKEQKVSSKILGLMRGHGLRKRSLIRRLAITF